MVNWSRCVITSLGNYWYDPYVEIEKKETRGKINLISSFLLFDSLASAKKRFLMKSWDKNEFVRFILTSVSEAQTAEFFLAI